jgi:hypothetical protein
VRTRAGGCRCGEQVLANLAVVRAVYEAVDGEPELGGGIGSGDDHVSLNGVQFEHAAKFVEVDAAAAIRVSFVHHLAKTPNA